MQSILITGANGFVGYYLTQALLRQGHRVVATGKGACRLPFRDGHFEYRELDFTDRDGVQSCLEQVRPAVVVHSGAISKPDECELHKEFAYQVNVLGTEYLLEAAARCGSHFLFLSTDFVFSGDEGMYDEAAMRAPVNYYGQTKVEAEDRVIAYERGWSIVRTVLVYGKPFLNRSNLLTMVAQALAKGDTLKIFDDQVRTPTYVEDLAEALVRIIEQRKEGIYHISGEDVLTPYQMALAVAAYRGLDASRITKVAEADFDQPARRPPKTGFNITKARVELGYQPTSFQEGMRRTFEGT